MACEVVRFGGGGGVGVALGTGFVRTGAGGVGAGGCRGPFACVDGCRFLDNCVASVVVTILGVGSGCSDLAPRDRRSLWDRISPRYLNYNCFS